MPTLWPHDSPIRRSNRYSPGPVGSPYVYGHVWVVLALLARRPSWGVVALPLLARPYVRKTSLPRLHLDYEQLTPFPLKWVESEGVPLSYKVEDKMRLSKDKTAVRVNPSLTLESVPPETFLHRLGNRSALDWVIDQYQVTEDKRSGIRSDPNRPDDPEYIVRLVGQVIQVSVETVKIVANLPERYAE
jgi:hypothetical protein